MGKGRLEAFSDGVIAIIITVMVLELKVPHGTEPADLLPAVPNLLSYVLSFAILGIYWNNHHHLFQAVHHVTGAVLWANLHLLFWLSLVPFVTNWLGETFPAHWPVAAYGAVLLMAAVAYFFLVLALVASHGKQSTLAEALGRDVKGKLSVVLYVLGIALGFVNPWLGCSFYVLVALIWFIPDRRIEKKLAK